MVCACECMHAYLQGVKEYENVGHDDGEGHQDTTQPCQSKDGQQDQHCFHCSPIHTYTHTWTYINRWMRRLEEYAQILTYCIMTYKIHLWMAYWWNAYTISKKFSLSLIILYSIVGFTTFQFFLAQSEQLWQAGCSIYSTERLGRLTEWQLPTLNPP